MLASGATGHAADIARRRAAMWAEHAERRGPLNALHSAADGERQLIDRLLQDVTGRERRPLVDATTSAGARTVTDELRHALLDPSVRGVLLHGPAGLGKTSHVVELAHTSATPVYALDPLALIQSTGLRGDLEARLQLVIDEMNRRGGVLFIDEAQAIANMGRDDKSGAPGMLDLFKLLSTSDGQRFRTIFATNVPDAFLDDDAFMRRVANVEITPPSASQLRAIAQRMSVRMSAELGPDLPDAHRAVLLNALHAELPTVTPAAVERTIGATLTSAALRQNDFLGRLRDARNPAYSTLLQLVADQRQFSEIRHEAAVTTDSARLQDLRRRAATLTEQSAALFEAAAGMGLTRARIEEFLQPTMAEVLDGARRVSTQLTGPSGSSASMQVMRKLSGRQGEQYTRALVEHFYVNDADVMRVIHSSDATDDKRARIASIVYEKLQQPRFMDRITPLPADVTPIAMGSAADTWIRDAILDSMSNRRLPGAAQPEQR